MRDALAAAVLAWAACLPAAAHDGHHHHGAAPPPIALGDVARRDPLPVDITIDASFQLIDQHGDVRSRDALTGTPTLVFFGYANCDGVCLAGIPAIAEATRLLAAKGHGIRPVLITIDPERDTPAALQRALGAFHPDFVGLTGSDAALAQARRLFHVQATPTHTDRDGGTVYQHGTFVYLLDAEARFLTLFPPVLPPAQMAEIVAGYL